MKKKSYLLYIVLIAAGAFSISCNDYLDRGPLSQVTPEVFFKSEADLEAYSITRYKFPSHSGWNAGTFIDDNHTDNQAGVHANNRWLPGEWRVEASGGAWNFDEIRHFNYFLEAVLPNWKAKKITGNEENIKHYIGEVYFLRAYEYYSKLRSFGDFPIIRRTFPDQKDLLVEASKRRPSHEVARFILSDLDSAIMLMKTGPFANKNRLSKEVAQLFKSRVALYEGTWLKHHKGTAQVPGGTGWPGAGKVDNFSIDIDGEIAFFLGQAMEAAKAVAERVKLVESNKVLTGVAALENPYFKMFGDLDMSGYSEVLLWRHYDAQFVGHHTMHYLNGGAASGYTRNFVESFLMENGLPIYAAGSGYKGDEDIADVLASRDHRLRLFTAAPGDTLVKDKGETLVASYPDILDLPERRAVTGYNVKKGVYGFEAKFLKGENPTTTGCIIFRATEAYLNYIEAAYEKNGSLDQTASTYWKQLRRRAGLPEDYNVTISATDLAQEQDWGKYSAGKLIDKTLYNIRRERRCELMAEGMRLDDLRRWRALDQVKNYQIEGFKLWGTMQDKYVDKDNNKSKLITLPSDKPNVSRKENSMYLRPYQIVEANNKFYNGYNWTSAHYLSPIAFEHFVLTSPDGKAENSVIYQNPGWPLQAGGKPNGF